MSNFCILQRHSRVESIISLNLILIFLISNVLTRSETDMSDCNFKNNSNFVNNNTLKDYGDCLGANAKLFLRRGSRGPQIRSSIFNKVNAHVNLENRRSTS